MQVWAQSVANYIRHLDGQLLNFTPIGPSFVKGARHVEMKVINRLMSWNSIVLPDRDPWPLVCNVYGPSHLTDAEHERACLPISEIQDSSNMADRNYQGMWIASLLTSN
jgi:hypothetical protein